MCLLYLVEVVTPTSSSLQAIHARSLLPCPDTPASKLTYNAEVTVKDSRYTVLMSALSRGRKSYMGIANTFLFEQPVRAQQSPPWMGGTYFAARTQADNLSLVRPLGCYYCCCCCRCPLRPTSSPLPLAT